MLVGDRHVVLVGPMGSGKSAVGRALARRLRRDHVDIDDLVVAGAGRAIAEIFDRDGEPTFRALESEALGAALDGPAVVISTGGGIVLADDNRHLLTAGHTTVVWLDATVEALLDRVGDGRDRPLLRGNVRDRLAATVATREPLYAEVADLRVDTTRLSCTDVVDEIVAALEQEVTA